MHAIGIGDLFFPNRTELPERNEYNYYDVGHELIMMYGSPTAQEIEDIRKGPVKFQVYVQPETLVLLFKFGSQPWCDAFFSYWAMPEDRRAIPPVLTETQMPVLTVYLLDANTGKVVVIRQLTMPNKFGQKLHTAITEQSKNFFPAEAVHAATNRLLEIETRDLVDLAQRQK
jgi:hypothetical protein